MTAETTIASEFRHFAPGSDVNVEKTAELMAAELRSRADRTSRGTWPA